VAKIYITTSATMTYRNFKLHAGLKNKPNFKARALAHNGWTVKWAKTAKYLA
jgi:hypothetical protein